MKKTGLAIIVLFMCLSIAHVLAQGKKRKAVPPPPTVTNVEIVQNADSLKDLEIDSLLLPDTNTTPRYFLFPEFFSYWPISKGDTVIKYVCYDAENSYINIDTLHDIDDVRHIQLVKVFANLLHTYIDADGRPRPSSASKIIYKYDKSDNQTWKTYDAFSGFIGELKEFKNDITKQDTTTVINPLNNSKHLIIRKYYKVVEEKHKGEVEQEKQ